MKCEDARSLVKKIHTFEKKSVDSINQNDRQNATDHIKSCEECWQWFYIDMCFAASQRLDDEDIEEAFQDYVVKTHMKVHEELGDNDYCRIIAC
ncbi:MAG: hypothetical protein HYV65_00510 [Candidatus Spechtbacteria bacterium]|nr:hypothetical protein [Candidatus Spechtbacteria bacterium]